MILAPSDGGAVVPLERLPGISSLALGLATGTPDVSAFLPDPPALAVVADRARRVLREFVPRNGAPPGLAELAQARSAGIFTGQQVGLFTGPLLTTVKAIAASRLAADLRGLGIAASAVFWCASEDHDLVEVTRLVLPHPKGPVEAGPDPAALADNHRPVGELPIELDIEALLAAGISSLAQPPDPEVMEALRRLNTKKSYREAFVGTLGWLLEGEEIAFVDAARREDKPALIPLAVRLVRERAEVKRLLVERGAALEAAGHPLQVTGDPAALPLFAIVNGERRLLREKGAQLELKGSSSEKNLETEEVVARFESGEWLPSFSAMTRPLAASHLFPIAATILGPAEIAYWAQAMPLFSWAGIVPPVLIPRPMVALVEPAIRRLLGKLELAVDDLMGGPEPLLKSRGANRAAGVLERVAALRAKTLEELGTLREELTGLDASLPRALETTSEKIEFALDKLIERATEAAGRSDETLARQLERLGDALLPGGSLAERVYSPLPYLLRVGRSGLVEPLRRALRWDRAGLQVIDL